MQKLSGVEWLKLWQSLTAEERRAVMLIQGAQEQRRKSDFYRAKLERGEAVPRNYGLR